VSDVPDASCPVAGCARFRVQTAGPWDWNETSTGWRVSGSEVWRWSWGPRRQHRCRRHLTALHRALTPTADAARVTSALATADSQTVRRQSGPSSVRWRCPLGPCRRHLPAGPSCCTWCRHCRVCRSPASSQQAATAAVIWTVNADERVMVATTDPLHRQLKNTYSKHSTSLSYLGPKTRQRDRNRLKQ